MKGLIAHNDKQKGQSDVADKSRTQVRAHLMLTCPLGFCIFFLLSADFFKTNFFQKILSGIRSDCQTVWIQQGCHGHGKILENNFFPGEGKVWEISFKVREI